MERIKIHREDGKVIGYVEGTVFHKVVSKSEHFLIIPPAIANDVCSLKEAEAAGAIWVDIYDRDERKDYWAPMKLIWERGFHLDRNFGDQRALPMQLWTDGPMSRLLPPGNTEDFSTVEGEIING